MSFVSSLGSIMKGYLDLQKLLVLVFEYGFDHVEYPRMFAIRSQFHLLPNIVIVTWETVKNTFADISNRPLGN